ALIGGETAEMPGMYQENEYDIAGFAVGIVQKSELITAESIKAGDVIIGLRSSGIHSNGYSLVRKLVKEYDLEKVYDGFSKTLGEILLTPTKIYAKPVAAVMAEVTIRGITHVTGGGFYENFPRMLPAGLGVEINKESWEIPHIFSLLQEIGKITPDEMYGIFNMGIGMAV